MPICMDPNCNGRSTCVYAPMYTMCHANNTAHARVNTSPRPRCTSAPVSRYRPNVATTMPTITGGRGSRRLITDSMIGVMITYSPVRNADVDGDVYCNPMVCVA